MKVVNTILRHLVRKTLPERRERKPIAVSIPDLPPSTKLVMPGSVGEAYPTLCALVRAFEQGATETPDLLMFGDSVVERVSRHDTDTRTLADMVAGCVAPRRLLALTRSAHNPRIYKWLLRVLERQPNRPRIIVLPVNLRCFSPQWHLSPDWHFEQELWAIKGFLDNATGPIPPIADVFYDPMKHHMFEHTPVRYPLSDFETIGQFRDLVRSQPASEEERALRSKGVFIFHYTHPLVADHPKLQSLRACAELARHMGVPALIYLTPINIEAGRRIVGPPFVDILRRNAAAVLSTLNHAGPQVCDWTELLPETEFFHEDLATEHLNEHGRQKLATLIGEKSRILANLDLQ